MEEQQEGRGGERKNGRRGKRRRMVGREGGGG